MRKFIVVALSVSGKGKKIYSSGDEVQESGFPEGVVDDLVKGKYIKEIFEDPEQKPMKNEDDGKAQKTASNKKEVKGK